MEGGYYGSNSNGEKKFWRTRIIFIISLSIIILVCSFFISGNISSRAKQVQSLFHNQDNPQPSELTYINNPEIGVLIAKIQIFMYVDIGLKVLLVVICISLVIVVLSALKIHQGPERESLLESPAFSHDLHMTTAIPGLSLSAEPNNEIMREGIVYEPYTEAVITTLAQDESTPAVNKVSNALYKYGPKAAQKMLEILESTLSQEEMEYFKSLSERSN